MAADAICNLLNGRRCKQLSIGADARASSNGRSQVLDDRSCNTSQVVMAKGICGEREMIGQDGRTMMMQDTNAQVLMPIQKLTVYEAFAR